MKKSKEKQMAISMRMSGMSYNQIRSKINVSKSTLSLWLNKYPLSPEKIKELRDNNPVRIEKYRNTRLRQRQEKLRKIYSVVAKDIGKFSDRDLFISGLFLYWGEGTKAARDIVAFTNTDPFMINFFIKWIGIFGVNKSDLKIKLHLYSDMDVSEKIKYWSKTLGISEKNFSKPYVKESKFSSLTYKNSFGQGTCSVIYGNSLIYNKIMMSLKYIREVVSIG